MGGELEVNEIINRIKNRRQELDLSYQDLSDLTGISKSTLQRYETGFIKKVPITQIEIIAKALNVSPGYLMGWEDNKPLNDTTLSPRDERQIAADLDNQNAMAAMGGTVEDDEDRELLATMRLAKEKYRQNKD